MAQAPGQFIAVFILHADSMACLKLAGNFLNPGRQDAAASRPADGFCATCVNQQGAFNTGAKSQPAFAELQSVLSGNEQRPQLFALQDPGNGIRLRT